jgi:hypothetical protein
LHKAGRILIVEPLISSRGADKKHNRIQRQKNRKADMQNCRFADKQKQKNTEAQANEQRNKSKHKSSQNRRNRKRKQQKNKQAKKRIKQESEK